MGPPSYWLGGQGIWPVAQGVVRAGASSLPDQLLFYRFEQAFVSSLIYNWDGEYFWTALQDLNSTGSFRWLSGDEVMYTHWNRDQPGEPFLHGTWPTPSLTFLGKARRPYGPALPGPSPRASQ